ncbi:MAG: MFS transporter [Dehalococcoidales bacterium]|jgi:EmrB/QacA subfamily drug resistance transporter|nr:MFS transporter [Dehalococcoidales bacterium]
MMATLLFCLFVTSINQSVVSIAGPSIVANLGGFEYYAWIFTAFSLTSAIVVPIIGKLNDLFGPKKVMVPSLVLFAFSTLICGLSNNMIFFIFSRAIQGIGFAGVLGIVWIMVASLWEPRQRGKWLGITSAGFTTAGVLGPIIGGVINDLISWRWIFFVNIPFCVIAIITIIKLFPSSESLKSNKFDFKGAIIFAIFGSTFLLAISLIGQNNTYFSMNIIILFLVAIVSLIIFIYIEKNNEEGIVDLNLFKLKYFTGGMIGSLFIVISWTVWTVFLPLSLIGVYGFSSSKASIALISLSIGSAIGANIFGNLIGRIKLQLPIAILGFTIVGISMIISGYTNLDINFNLLLVLALIVGFGSTGAFSAYTVPIQNNLPEEKLGIITTSLQFARVFGISLGSSLLGVILLTNMTTYNYDPPRQDLYNPDNITSKEKILDIKKEYLEQSSLKLFEEDLEISRSNLKKGLRIVYFAASVPAFLGIIVSMIIFYKPNRRLYVEEGLEQNE